MQRFKYILGFFILCGSLTTSAVEGLAEFKKNFERPTSVPYPDDNKYTTEREILGRALFFDPRLSGSGMISCSSCHNPSFNWTDSLPLAVGHGHQVLTRKSPTIVNLAWTTKLMWDGRFATLEEQVLGPITSPGEMNMALDGEKGLVRHVRAIGEYKEMFEKAYPNEEIGANTVARAIATFERGIISAKAPFDQYIEGNEDAISERAKRGFALFNTKANCVQCHSGWAFSDGSFHDIGLPSSDIGRGKYLKLKSQQHAFKTPGLRNIARRAPYMHDGSEKSLQQVVDFYSSGGKAKRESLSALIKPLKLSDEEKLDLIAFMQTLTSNDPLQNLPNLPK